MIPAEAVEAAAKRMAGAMHGLWELVPASQRRVFLRDARLALEAAAPHMLAGAWEEAYGLGYADSNVHAPATRTNPYRPTP